MYLRLARLAGGELGGGVDSNRDRAVATDVDQVVLLGIRLAHVVDLAVRGITLGEEGEAAAQMGADMSAVECRQR